MLKECPVNGVVPFVVADDMKLFRYRGFSEWGNERGFLVDARPVRDFEEGEL